MQYLTFTKLKAFKKANELSEKIKILSNLFSGCDQYGLSLRMKNNADSTMRYLKQAWTNGKKKEDFIEFMDQLILNNSELELLLFEGQSYNLIDTDSFGDYMEDCCELKVLLLEMINNVGLYFEKKRAPKDWFDL